jgi:hypothetical protein
MQMIRVGLGCAVLLLPLVACTGFPFFRNPDEASRGSASTAGHPESPIRAVLEFQNIGFDGESLSGRLLVGVEEGTLTLDKRLIENASVEVKSVSDCATGQPIGFLLVDYFPEPVREDELQTLTPGYWYGANVRFSLFDEQIAGIEPPECFEAELRLRAEDGSVAGRLRIRAEQKAPPPPDAGVPSASPESAGPGGLDAGCGTGSPDAATGS